MQRRSNNFSFFIMEKTVVTFKTPDTEKFIELNFTYDKENSDLNYTVNLSEGYNLSDNMDLTGFLAHMFLTMLETNK